MAQKAEFIKVPPAPNGLPQTVPTEPSRRVPRSDIEVSEAVVDDLPRIVEGFYTCLSQDFWEKTEPLARRPPSEAMRHESMIKRLFPTFSHPQVHWVVARYVPTGEIIACAGWTAPGSPIHNYFRKSAVDFYGWRDQYNCSDEKFEELWSQVDDENWNKHIADNDDVRKSVFGDEPHWYLAPIFTWPEWQGRGVGKLLLDWAIEQADANDPPTPLYLESAPTARPVYMHCGFVPLGKTDFVRRGPAIVRGLEAEEDKDDANVAKINSNAGVGEKVSAKDV